MTTGESKGEPAPPHSERTSAEPALPDRLLPEVPFPPYSYVPGMFPHPISDPAGHTFGVAVESAQPLDPARWRQSHALCRGIDLFNHGYYWEAHEVWEGLWHAAGRRGAVADLIKGLIKLAAAGVKAREGRLAGVQRYAARASELFTAATQQLPAAAKSPARFAGFELGELSHVARQLAAVTTLPPQTRLPAQRVLNLVLRVC